MSNRAELITEIKEARKNAKSDLLYVKGLTKMKKEELSEIAGMLRDVKEQQAEDGAEDIDIEIKRLNQEKECLEEELVELEDEEDGVRGELQELDLAEIEDETLTEQTHEAPLSPESEELPPNNPPLTRQVGEYKKEGELVDTEEFVSELEKMEVSRVQLLLQKKRDALTEKKRMEEAEKERQMKEKQKKEQKRHVRMTKPEIEEEIKKLMCRFSNKLSVMLKPFQRKYRNGTLSEYDTDEMVDFHNDMREDTKDRIELMLYDLDDDDDLSDRFNRYVNDYFNRQRQRVERILR
jgi:hypothetical protein